MRNPLLITALLTSLALPTAMAADPSNALSYANVQLNAAGELAGQAVDAGGVPRQAVKVQMTDGHRTWVAITDTDGRFRFPVNACRTCVLQIDDQYFGCRVWKQDIAPKGSLTSIALVNSEQDVARGQLFRRFRRGGYGHSQHLTPDKKYGLALLAGGGIAAYMALSRDNASE